VLTRYRLGEDPFVFAPGAVRAKKNLAALLYALAERKQRGVRLLRVLVTGGDDPALRADLGLATKLGLDRWVTMLDEVAEADMPSLYRLASAVAVLSRSEGFGAGRGAACAVVAARERRRRSRGLQGSPSTRAAGSVAGARRFHGTRRCARAVERTDLTWDAAAEKVTLWLEPARAASAPRARRGRGVSGGVRRHNQELLPRPRGSSPRWSSRCSPDATDHPSSGRDPRERRPERGPPAAPRGARPAARSRTRGGSLLLVANRAPARARGCRCRTRSRCTTCARSSEHTRFLALCGEERDRRRDRAAGVITVSGIVRRTLAEHFKPRKLFVVPNAGDHLRVLPRERTPGARLLDVGHLEPRKNLELLLRALALDPA
jgi:glycosyltransferase involved in cell wall biosynthesis